MLRVPLALTALAGILMTLGVVLQGRIPWSVSVGFILASGSCSVASIIHIFKKGARP